MFDVNFDVYGVGFGAVAAVGLQQGLGSLFYGAGAGMGGVMVFYMRYRIYNYGKIEVFFFRMVKR